MRNQRSLGLLAATMASFVVSACSEPLPPTAVTVPTVPTAVPQPTGRSPSGPTGSCALTLTASPICAVVKDTVSGALKPMPETALVRRYEAELREGYGRLTAADGTGNQVPLGGVDGYVRPGMPLMTLEADLLIVVVPCAGGDYWSEPFDDAQGTGAFEFCGSWIGQIQPSGNVEGMVGGSFDYYLGKGPHWSTHLFCGATDHRFTLVKHE
jgi:hypothetical protein